MTYGAETWTLTKQAQQTCSRTDQNGKKYAQHHMQGLKTNIWVRERTKVIIISNVRIFYETFGPGQGISTTSKMTDGPRVSPFGDHIYDKKRRQGRPAKRWRPGWRDNLYKYWSNTIWQRIAQDRLTLRQHAEAFAQPRDTTAA